MSKPGSSPGQGHKALPVVGEAMTEGLLVVSRQGEVVYANQAAADMLGIDRQALPMAIDDYFRQGQEWLSDDRPVSPDDFPMRRLWQGQEFTDVELGLDRQGSRRWLTWNGRQVRDAPDDVQGIAVLRDVTAERRRRSLWRIASSAATQLSLEPDLQVTLEGLLDAMIDALGPDTAISIWRADVQSKELELIGQRNLSRRTAQLLEHLPFSAPLVAAKAATTGQTQIVEDTRKLPRSLTMSYQVVERENLRSYISLPLKAAGNLRGVLNIGSRSPRAFAADEAAALEVVADLLGSAMLANATRRESQREHARLLELARQLEATAKELRTALDSTHLPRHSRQSPDRTG